MKLVFLRAIRGGVLAIVVATLFSACANTTFIGHKHAFNFETELKPDMSSPLNMNFGYVSHSAVVVPPRDPLRSKQLRSSQNVAKGDLLSTWSVFKIERTPNQFADFTIRTGVATGLAASNLATPSPKAVALEANRVPGIAAPAGGPSGISDKMNKILFAP